MKFLIFAGLSLMTSLALACRIKGNCETHSLHQFADGQIFDKVKQGPSGQCYRPDLDCRSEKEINCGGPGDFDETQIQLQPKEKVHFGSQYGVAKFVVKHAYQNQKDAQEFVFNKPGTHDFPVDPVFLESDPTRVGFFYRCTAEIQH